MQWWCTARDVAWSWSWQGYPGVWLFVMLLGTAYVALARRSQALPAQRRAGAFYFALGLLVLWAALDWPIGPLGAGYLASVHMLQFLLIALVAPPLLLLGVRRVLAPEPAAAGSARAFLRSATHPLATLIVFAAITIATHLPVVTDTLMWSQAGSFLFDMAWLLAGLIYWWPVLAPDADRPRFSPPVKMVYLFASMIIMTAPGAMITFSNFPIYSLFELAPPIAGITKLGDQRIAGILMRLGSGTVCWTSIAILFFRWNREEERAMREEASLAPAAGPAVGPQT